MMFSAGSDSPLSVQYFSRASGLPGDNVGVIFEDAEDNVWLGFNGDGLSLLTNDAFQFFVPGKQDEPKSIIFVCKSDNDYFLGTPSGFYLFNPLTGSSASFVKFSGQDGKVEIASFYADDEGKIWIGTKGDGLYVRNRAGKISRFFKSGDSGSDYIVNIGIAGDNIWLSTLNGVVIISRNNGGIKKIYNINNGLPHNSINQVLIAADGSGMWPLKVTDFTESIPTRGSSFPICQCMADF